MKRLAVLTVIAVSALVGCGGGGGDGGGNPAPIPPTVDVTGTWDASMTVIGGDTSLPVGYHWTGVFTVIQSDSTASGTFVTSVGGSGKVSGSVSGNDLDMTITQTSPCAGTYSGIGIVNSASNQMSGTYIGVDCYGIPQTSFTATKR